jgi:hypothetical protein
MPLSSDPLAKLPTTWTAIARRVRDGSLTTPIRWHEWEDAPLSLFEARIFAQESVILLADRHSEGFVEVVDKPSVANT